MTGFLTVALGGAFGAMARYGLGLAAGRFTDAAGLYATFLVNIIGSALMGILMAWLVGRAQTGTTDTLYLLLGVGLLGGFTTFSAFSLEIVHLLNSGAYLRAGAYGLVSVAVGVAALLIAFAAMKRVLA